MLSSLPDVMSDPLFVAWQYLVKERSFVVAWQQRQADVQPSELVSVEVKEYTCWVSTLMRLDDFFIYSKPVWFVLADSAWHVW